MQRTLNWCDEESDIAKCRSYTEEEKKHFCEVYAKRWNKSTGDCDTAEQAFLEPDYGYMLAVALNVYNMLCYLDDQGEKGLLNLLGLDQLLDESVAQYAKMGLD